MQTQNKFIELELKGLAESRDRNKLANLFFKPDKFELILNNVDNKSIVVPMTIEFLEAQSIATYLENMHSKLPLTHDLFKLAVDKFGFKLDHIKIHSIDDEGTFHSTIFYSNDTKQIQLESRTIDAVALAVRHNGKIFIDETIYNKSLETLE
jgi:hypothetical protein